MNHVVPLTLSLALILALGGCGKSEEPAKEAAAPATEAAKELKSDVGKAMEAATEKGKEAMESASEKGGELMQSAKEQGADLADAAVAKAEELIAKVKQYIDERDFDLAGKAMEQLRTMKDSLPESVQGTIDQLEQMLSSAMSSAPPAQGQ